MSVLSQEVNARLRQGRVVDEMSLRDLMSGIAECVGGTGETAEAYATLARDVDALYAYGDMAESPAFCAGAVWGMIGLHEAIVDSRRL
jgi:hypothetical protein